jgi:hypothetical protein
MARIIVQADDRRTVLLDEQDIKPEHIGDKHSAVQIMERLEWAVRDEAQAIRARRRRGASPPIESAPTRTFD